MYTRETYMLREDLNFSSLFRCPISLDVMESPVCLCTGVTYDRSSILRWLDSGHHTCPVTMEVLHTKDLVPNRTLERLIQTWSGRDNRVNAEPAETNSESEPTLSKQHIMFLVETITFSKKPFDGEFPLSLAKILRFATESAENRRFLANIQGLESLLIDFLGRPDEHSSKSFDVTELAVRVLEIALRRSEERENLIVKNTECLNSIARVMQRGDRDSKIASLKIIESIAIDPVSKLLVAEEESLILQLQNLISPSTDSPLLQAVLSRLISLSKLKGVKMF